MNTMQIRLHPNTNRLRQLVHDHGDVWNVLDKKFMPCFNGDVGFQIRSLDGKHTRNVTITICEEI